MSSGNSETVSLDDRINFRHKLLEDDVNNIRNRNGMPSLQPTKLPADPVKRVETFGCEAIGRTRWKSSLAEACGVTERVVHWWLSGHCPADLDQKLITAANNLISEHHQRTAVIRAYRDQLEQGTI
jgi:hypothetical protein